MLDLDANKQEINLAHNHVFEMVSVRTSEHIASSSAHSLALVVLKFDMQTVFDPDFHLNCIVRVGWHSI